MSQFSGFPQAAVDYDSTILGALDLSEKKWVLAVQLPGVGRHSRHALDACGDGLVSFVERLKAKCAAAGRKIARVILTHEGGRDGFWLARFLARREIEAPVMQPSSLPVDRRARRAKTDMIDAEMLLRTLMAWLKGRTSGLFDGSDSERGRRGSAARASGTGGFDQGAAIDRQQDRRHFGDAGHQGTQGFAAGSPRAIELRTPAGRRSLRRRERASNVSSIDSILSSS